MRIGGNDASTGAVSAGLGAAIKGQSKRVRIIVADNRRLCRECLRLLIETFDPDLEVSEATDAAEIAALLAEDPNCSVVMYNLVVRGEEGIGFVQSLQEAIPNIPLIVLCDFDDEEVMRQVMKGGAKAFLPSTTPSPVLISVLRLVIAGGTYVPASVLLGREGENRRPSLRAGQTDRESVIAQHFPLLTPRQRSVLALLSLGYMNRDIASELGMCENTVKAHVKQVMRKLEVDNRTQAALMADRLVA